MGKRREKVRKEERPTSSRYAEKVRKRRMTFESPPIEHKEEGRSATGQTGKHINWPKRVRARITDMSFHKGCVFLETNDGQRLFMGLCKWQKRYRGGKELSVGLMLECDIVPHSSDNTKDPRVIRIISVNPPDTT